VQQAEEKRFLEEVDVGIGRDFKAADRSQVPAAA
jgi:hypothetical protein